MPETVIASMAEWSHGLAYEQIPERVRKKARLQLFSVMGAICASARHEIGKIVLESVGSWAGDGPSTIMPTGKKADVLSAAYANAALSVALDYDDYLLFGHTGHSAVAASLAVAQKEGRGLKDVIAAMVIANEIEGRLGASVSLGPHNGQAWSHIHLAGAAAASAKLMGLDVEKTAHAIAISMYQPTYVLFPGFMGPDSKATTSATPTVTGIQAAMLAARGATGPLDVIEHPQGFLARFSYVPSPFFISGFGRAWTTDTLAYKVYPGCAYIDTTVDAVLKIREKVKEDTGKELDPADVTEVLVEATILTIEMDHLSKVGGSFDPLNPVSINFSIPGNVAIALLKGRLSADDLSRTALKENADPILALSAKVKLKHDWNLTMHFLDALDETLKLRKIMGELKIKDLISFRLKAREQYKSSMGLSLRDLRQITRQSPELKSRIWAGIKGGFGSSGRGGGRGGGFDLGLCPLDQFTMPFAARVTIKMKGGLSTTFQQEVPWGGPGYPLDMTRDFVLDKYSREKRAFSGDTSSMEELIEAADTLEAKLSPDKLMDLCCGS